MRCWLGSLTIATIALATSGCERSLLPEAKPALVRASTLPSAPPLADAPVTPSRPAETSSANQAEPAELPRPSRGKEVAVPAGVLRVGSPTGSPNRNPAREADDIALELSAFSIDALPYPNDPNQPPRTNVTRAEAEKLCATEGKRLCSELEWERACKGARGAEYPGRAPFDLATCSGGADRCANDLGVFALGTLGREWTSSPAHNGDWDRMRSASVRGAAKDASAVLHRCAARDAAAPESRSDSLLFRCCRGAEQSVSYPIERDVEAFKELALDNEAARESLRAMPETRALAEGFRLQTRSSTIPALAIAGRSTQSLAPWLPASPAFHWSPLRGEQIVILSGSSPEGALVIAYYPSASGPRFAGSYLTKGEHAAILIAYKPDAREELLYSTCWGCGGEGGALRLDATARLRFMPR